MSSIRVKKAVDRLLEEATRVCSACEAELGTPASQDARTRTHGLCRRHTAAMYKEAGFSDDQIEKILVGKGEGYFCPDLSIGSLS